MNATRNEEWRPIPGYEGYEASTCGRIRSVSRTITCKNGVSKSLNGRVLKELRASRGDHVNVSIRGYPTAVHRLVLLAFVGPAPDGMECCHCDGNAANNRIENLRWDTHLENMRDLVRHGTGKASRTRCKQGHEYTDENTYRPPNRGGRVCRTCMVEHRRKWRQRNIGRAA